MLNNLEPASLQAQVEAKAEVFFLSLSPQSLSASLKTTNTTRYLSNDGYVFVTADGKLRDRVGDSCEQKQRIWTFDEAMQKLKKVS